MKIYLDTANIESIKEAYACGMVEGVTTNPTLISREGKNFNACIEEILECVDGPVMAEVISLDAEGMVREGRDLASKNSRIIVKIPMCKEGLKAVKILASEQISTNVTLVFSAAQAVAAANAGADYVSIFLGRMDDIGGNGLKVAADVKAIFEKNAYLTKVVAASVRHLTHFLECARIGLDIATVPAKLVEQMLYHPLSEKGLEQFLKDWEKVPE